MVPHYYHVLILGLGKEGEKDNIDSHVKLMFWIVM